ncbi:MAG: hypothetical protein KIPDCIKN_01771 [Haliscomenobacter sp.]|nr:hypothetical protein [Haliscomenobacter sp.]
MKKVILIAALLGFFLHPLWSQKTFQVETFDALLVSGNIQVILEPGEKEKVVLYIDGIPEDEITVKVSQGTLRLISLNSFLYKNEVIKAYVTYNKLREIRANAGSSVSCDTELQGDQLEARAGSGAQLRLKVKANALEASAMEGGQLYLDGASENLDCTAATGGQFFGAGLTSKRVYVRANTGGRAEVHATEHLEVSANTGGEIIYHGDPQTKYVKSILGGEVRQGRI